jgi:uncharacterized protein (TIGR02452 family)
MITKDGVAVTNARTKNASIAKETIKIIKEGHYTALSGAVIDLSEDFGAAIKGTILHQDPLPIQQYTVHVPTFEVLNETTAQAAVRLMALGMTDIVGLNFASARNPGGGFLAGAMAQEEDLCRCSGLYACIKNKPMFYNDNILCDDTFYTHNIIYSPKVPFFRDQYNLFMENPFTLSIISAPAPNLRNMESVDEKLVYNVLYERAVKIFQIAALYGHKTIILGAWGCGAFGNDAKMVANVFLDALKVVPAFEHVCFACFDNRPDANVFETFKREIL